MAAKELQEEMVAPAFKAPSTLGKDLSLKDFKGKSLVIYFYPRDSTPGCTQESCDFRDAKTEIEKLGGVVLGVSKDSMTSHDKFIEKYDLNFPLLSDPDRKMIEAFGVWKEKKMYGKKTMGVERSTFLIDKNGVIKKAWRKVKVKGHLDEVIEALKELK